MHALNQDNAFAQSCPEKHSSKNNTDDDEALKHVGATLDETSDVQIKPGAGILRQVHKQLKSQYRTICESNTE